MVLGDGAGARPGDPVGGKPRARGALQIRQCLQGSEEVLPPPEATLLTRFAPVRELLEEQFFSLERTDPGERSEDTPWRSRTLPGYFSLMELQDRSWLRPP